MIDFDDCTFDEDVHEYRNPRGLVCPSVTGTLKHCEIFDYSMVDPDLLERKRILGQNVHHWTADVDRYGLANVDPCAIIPLEREYADGWLAFCASVRPRWIEIERPMLRRLGGSVVDPDSGVEIGGTPDRIALIGRRLWVLDIKCSAMMHPGWGLQLADYEMLHTGLPFVGHMGRMIVRLIGGGKFRTASFMDPTDGVVGLAAARWMTNPADAQSEITVRNWRQNMRIYRDVA